MKTQIRSRLGFFILLALFACLLLSMLSACEAGAEQSQPEKEQGQEQEQEQEQEPQNDETPDYELVELSTKNYSEYLTIGIELTDSNVEYIGQNAIGLDRYVLSCVGNIEISKTGNFQFENATILCGVIVQDWHDGMISANIKLNYDGEGRYSFHLSRESFSSRFDLTSRDCSVSVYAAKGIVRIYP